MARGKKYGLDVKEKVFALLDTGASVREIAREIGVAASTIVGWKAEYIECRGGNDGVKTVREEKRNEFVSNAWNVIESGQRLLMRRMKRAASEEERIDEAIDKLLTIKVPADLSRDLLGAIKTLSALKIEDPAKLSSIIGTMYDKQAIATKNDTQDVNIVIRRFEDF